MVKANDLKLKIENLKLQIRGRRLGNPPGNLRFEIFTFQFEIVFLLLLLALPAAAQKPMHFTRGNDVALQVVPLEEAKKGLDEIMAGARVQRVTAFEPYVKWMLLEPEPGKWDFSYYDVVLEACRESGMKWVPFLIAGPAYATPAWFKDGPGSVFAKCLEHGQETRTQSIWNPGMPARVDAFLSAFGERYDAKDIQAALLGISGDFGESIYTVSGNAWTYRWDGEYHHHRGWWCGDEHAARDFRAAMRRRYRTIGALNRAWGTRHASFEAVRPFLPETAKTRRARLDLVRWYRVSMTDYAETWIKAAKRRLPGVQVLLCTGGEGTSVLGADFTEQAIMAARHGAGIRITNEASDYGVNFMLTRVVGTACRNLGTYFGYEPAGEVTDNGLVARFYNVAASGAGEFFVYDAPAEGPRADIYRRYRPLLTVREPQVKAAMFYCKTSEELGVPGFAKGGDDWYAHSAAFRDYADVDFLDESLIAKGFLDRYRVLAWPDGAVTEAKTLKAIESWVKRGGLLFARVAPEDVDGSPWTERFRKLKGARIDPDREPAAWYEEIVRTVPSLFPDGKPDRLYRTDFKDGRTLFYNAADTQTAGIPAHAIVEKAK